MSASDSAALKEIRAYRPLGPDWGTSGQPTVEQFAEIQKAGFKAVVNLALPTSEHAIPNEGSVVAGQGMMYVNIPVNFEEPRAADFESFVRVMDAFHDRPVFVHCALNMRVSAFLYLYRVLHQHADPAEAAIDLRAIWEPDPAWRRFIDTQLVNAARGGAS